MGFWDDLLNGGLDRDFDGDIDSRDRDIYFLEEELREQEEKEKLHRYQHEDWKDYYLEELALYGIDADDYDDEEEFLAAIEVAKKEEWKNNCIDSYEFDDLIPQDYDTEEEYLEAIEERRRELQKDDENSASVTISFSVAEPKRTKPTTGVWKYYSDDFDGMWHFDQALIEQFPELAEDYEPNVSDSTLGEIIVETYEIDKERAVKYLKWLWKTFTPDLFADEKDSCWDRYSFRGRAALIQDLILENKGDEYLYNLLKTDKDFIIAGFKDCVHEKHNYNFVLWFIEEMLLHKDVRMTKIAYFAYLDGQKGRYSEKDLGKLWSDIAHRIDYLEIDDKEKLEIINSLLPLVEKLGVRSKKPLEEFNKIIKELKESIAYEEEEYEEEDFEEESSVIEDKYAWRKYIAPSKLRFANPLNYETLEDYEKAIRIAYIKHDEEKAKARRGGYLQSKICSFCKVDTLSQSKALYYYLTGELELNVGDEVIVPFGQDNKEISGIVVSVGKCYASAFPFEETKIKTVIRKK